MDNPIEVLYNSASIITVPIVHDNSSEFTPTTASYIIYNPGGDVLQGSTAGVISGSFVKITFPGAINYLENYRADLIFTNGTEQFNRSIYFDAVVMVLNQLLTDDELLDEYPLLNDLKWTSETDWRRFKRAAWRDIRSEIASRGYRPALCAPSSTAFVLPHKHLSFAKIFKGLFSSIGDEWYERWKFHDEQYRVTMSNVLSALKYDAGETKVLPPNAEINISVQKVWR